MFPIFLLSLCRPTLRLHDCTNQNNVAYNKPEQLYNKPEDTCFSGINF